MESKYPEIIKRLASDAPVLGWQFASSELLVVRSASDAWVRSMLQQEAAKAFAEEITKRFDDLIECGAGHGPCGGYLRFKTIVMRRADLTEMLYRAYLEGRREAKQ